MGPMALTRKQIAAGFGGKAAQRGLRTAGARKSNPMARKSPGRARRALSRGRSYGGRFKQPIDGALSAVARRAGAYVSPTMGPGAATLAVGLYRNNEALTTLGTAELVGRAIDMFAVPTVPTGANVAYIS